MFNWHERDRELNYHNFKMDGKSYETRLDELAAAKIARELSERKLEFHREAYTCLLKLIQKKESDSCFRKFDKALSLETALKIKHSWFNL